MHMTEAMRLVGMALVESPEWKRGRKTASHAA
jgi:hypothetical protein